MKVVSIAPSPQNPLTRVVLCVGNESVNKTVWLDAIYDNLLELDMIKKETKEKDLAKLLKWDVDSESAKRLSTDWSFEMDAEEFINRTDLKHIDNYRFAPAEELSICEIGEIVTKLQNIDSKWFKNIYK